MNIVLKPATLGRASSNICPGCADPVSAPRQRTQSHVVLDASGRPWHVGCVFAALESIPVYDEE